MSRCRHDIPGRGGNVTAVEVTPLRLVYRNKVLTAAVGGSCLFATAIFIDQAFTPGKGGTGLTVLAAVCAAACAGLTTRALVAPTITATHNGVRIRTFLRTRIYGWAEIERFQEVVKLVGGYSRKVLAITLASGETKAFNQLNGTPSRPGWIDEAVTNLNSYASKHQNESSRIL
jgi:Bacterial PH domain